jgi:hypothetical protein
MLHRMSAKRMGKMRARDEGPGGAQGTVLELSLADSSIPQS